MHDSLNIYTALGYAVCGVAFASMDAEGTISNLPNEVASWVCFIQDPFQCAPYIVPAGFTLSINNPAETWTASGKMSAVPPYFVGVQTDGGSGMLPSASDLASSTITLSLWKSADYCPAQSQPVIDQQSVTVTLAPGRAPEVVTSGGTTDPGAC